MRLIVLFLLGAAVAYAFCAFRTPSDNPGHANTNLHFDVGSALDRDQKNHNQVELLRVLLTIDVRYVSPPLKAAFYRYVSAVADETQAENERRDVTGLRARSRDALMAFQHFENE